MLTTPEEIIKALTDQAARFRKLDRHYLEEAANADDAESEAEYRGKSNAFLNSALALDLIILTIEDTETAQQRANDEREVAHYAALEALGNDD